MLPFLPVKNNQCCLTALTNAIFGEQWAVLAGATIPKQAPFLTQLIECIQIEAGADNPRFGFIKRFYHGTGRISDK